MMRRRWSGDGGMVGYGRGGGILPGTTIYLGGYCIEFGLG